MMLDDFFSAEEIRLIESLKGKSRAEQDEIIFDYERKMNNGKFI